MDVRVTMTFTLTVPVAEQLDEEENRSGTVDEALREYYDL